MEEENVPILRSETLHTIQMPVVDKTMNSHSISGQVNLCRFNCAFSRQENSFLDSAQRSSSAMKLCGLILFSFVAMVVEIIGGVKANSLSIMTDAGHLLSDIAGFSISLFSVWVSGWEATSQQSFGYSRLEVLGALLSVQLIWLISGILIYEAVDRILGPKARVNGILMFAIAAFGFFLNLFMVIWLGHDHSHHHHSHSHCSHHNDLSHQDHLDHDHEHEKELCEVTKEEGVALESNSVDNNKILNINLQGAYLHLLTDMIQSVGVMITGGVLCVKPDWVIVDLICTLVFSVLSLSTTFSMLRNITGILMERTPCEVNLNSLEDEVKNIRGVHNVHDLHIWSITVGKVVMSCHVIAEPGVSSSELISEIRDLCQKRYKIFHVTIQVE